MNLLHKALMAPIALVGIALAGCGGGSDNAPAEPTATTIFAVTNTGAANFSRVSIVAKDGSTTFDASFACAAGQQRCMLYYADKPFTGRVTLQFFDSANKLVSAYALAAAPGVYAKVYTSDWSTGYYLYQRLVRSQLPRLGLDQAQLNIRIDRFFTDYDSPDGKSDQYQEIATYYQKTGLSEQAFLTLFADRLAHDEIALVSELSSAKSAPQRTALAAYANPTECSSTLQAFLSVGGNIAGAFPIVGDILEGAFGIAGDYCDGTDAKLDAISSQLNKLQQSVDDLTNTVSDIALFLADNEQNRFATDAKKLKDDMTNFESAYEKFLASNNARSLVEYFAAKGGWDNALAGQEVLADILIAPYDGKTASGYLIRIDDITRYANFDTYISALNTKCAGQLRSSGAELVNRRQACNVAINVNMANIVGAQGIALRMIADIYAVFNKYGAAASAKYSSPVWVSGFSTGAADVKTRFDDDQKAAIAKFKNNINKGANIQGYFDVYAGIPDNLANNIKSRACKSVKGYDVPAISAWYLGGNEDDDYLVTQCGEVSDRAKRIQARYFLKDGAEFRNVMGVGVPSSSLAAGNVGAYNSAYSLNYWGLGLLVTDAIAFNSGAYDSVSDRYYFGDAIRPTEPADGCYFLTRGALCYSHWRSGVTPIAWAGIPTVRSYWYNLVRYTQGGYSYAIKLAVGSGGVNGYAYLFCMTADCSLTGSYGLAFKNGPNNLTWTPVGGAPADAPTYLELTSH